MLISAHLTVSKTPYHWVYQYTLAIFQVPFNVIRASALWMPRGDFPFWEQSLRWLSH